MKKIVLISLIYTFNFTFLHSQKGETKPFILGEIVTLQSTGLGEKRVLIGVGQEGKIMVSDAKKLAKKLKGLKNDKLSVHFEYFKKENHANILHQAVYNAFKIK